MRAATYSPPRNVRTLREVVATESPCHTLTVSSLCVTSMHSMTVREEKSRHDHLTLRLDEKLAAELRRVAQLNDRSVSAQVRQFIRDGLRDHLQEGVAA